MAFDKLGTPAQISPGALIPRAGSLSNATGGFVLETLDADTLPAF